MAPQRLTVAAGWCGRFRRFSWHTSLTHADRPPALFVQELGKHLQSTGIATNLSLVTDENLGTHSISTTALAAVTGADIAFLSSHGRCNHGDYLFRLEVGDWLVAGSIGAPGPAVAVFDTCELVDRMKTLRTSSWLHVSRPTPAVVLGFVGAATDGYRASQRGTEFAANLAYGSTFAKAWIDAVRATSFAADEPIAIAFGPSLLAAQNTLLGASLMNLPAPTVADHCWWETG